MPKQPQSFGEQAARFSFYAPIMAAVIAFVTRGNNGTPGVAVSIAALNGLLILAGLGLAVAALFSMRRYGRKGILVRAILGLLLNGLVVVALASLIWPTFTAGRTRAQVVGRWHLQSSSQMKAQTDIMLENSGKFDCAITGGDSGTAVCTGRWVMTHDRGIGITIDRVTVGDPSAVGTQFGLGTIRSVDSARLVLNTPTGDEVYTRE